LEYVDLILRSMAFSRRDDVNQKGLTRWSALRPPCERWKTTFHKGAVKLLGARGPLTSRESESELLENKTN
jgi:hypothetical protein